MAYRNKVSVKRVMTIPSSQQNVSPDFQVLSDSHTPKLDLSSPPKLITYDIFEKKLPQQLLYEVYRKRVFFFLENVFSMIRARKNELIPKLNGKISQLHSRTMTMARMIVKIWSNI
jgi:hypothetical protein